MPTIANPPPSRKAHCPCGSGRRYKDCHGALGAVPPKVAPDPTRLRQDAFDALGRNDLAAAEASARAVHAIDPRHPQAWDVLASCALFREDFAEALSCCDRAGLPDLVTRDLVEYEARAIELARAPDRLAALRRKVVEGRATSPLFDMASYVRGFEDALEAAWEEHRRARR